MDICGWLEGNAQITAQVHTFCHVTWASDLTSLGLCFSICKMGTVIVVVRIKCIIHVKHSEKCLAHNKHSVHMCCCCLYLEHLPESERIGAQHGHRE